MNKAKLCFTTPILLTARIEKLKRFYVERLGFIIGFSENSYVCLQRDNIEIHFLTNLRYASESIGNLRIEVECIEDLFEEYFLVNVVTPQDFIEKRGGREFSISDPDGNVLTFFEKGKPAIDSKLGREDLRNDLISSFSGSKEINDYIRSDC